MISVKYTSIIAVVAFVAGSFVASPELRAYAAATIGSDEIIDESIRSEDIKNGQVTAADIAANAVGASELQGVTQLQFAHCQAADNVASIDVPSGGNLVVTCFVPGVRGEDAAVASLNNKNGCFGITTVVPDGGKLNIVMKNQCPDTREYGTGEKISIVVFDK